MKKRKFLKIMLILLFVLGIVIYIVYSQRRNGSPENPIPISNDKVVNETTQENQDSISGIQKTIPKPDVFNNSETIIKDINWKLDPSSLPNNVPIFQIKNYDLSDDNIAKIAIKFGFKPNPTINDDEMVLLQDSQKSLTIYKKDLSLSYKYNLADPAFIFPDDTIDTEKLKSRLVEAVNKYFDINNLTISIDLIRYAIIDGYHYEPTTDTTKADVVSITAFYKYKNYKIYSKSLSSIGCRFLRDGRLVGLDIDLPFMVVDEIKGVPLKNAESLKSNNVLEYIVFYADGAGQYMEALDRGFSPTLDVVNVNSLNLRYTYIAGNNYIQPIAFLNSEATYGSDKVTVLLGLPALKESVYR